MQESNFPNLPNNAQKTAYATWVEELVQWTHSNDSNHPVCYADAGTSALGLLAASAPSLDIYGTNYYGFQTSAQLGAYLDGITAAWSAPAIFLHEYGSDSYSHAAGAENEAAQAQRIAELVQAVFDATPDRSFIGGSYFEFSDEWKFVAPANEQNPGNNYGWTPASCFDTYADEDYWGVARAVASGEAADRELKPGYNALRQMYGGVPEPASLGLFLAAAAVALLRPRRRP